MSIKSRIREKESGRGWDQEKRRAYREERIAQKIKYRMRLSSARPTHFPVEESENNQIIDF